MNFENRNTAKIFFKFIECLQIINRMIVSINLCRSRVGGKRRAVVHFGNC